MTYQFVPAETPPSDILRLCKGSPFRSIQGEGFYAGVPSTFVRLAGCNLRCCEEGGRFFNCDTVDGQRDYSIVQEEFRPLSSAAYEISVDDLSGKLVGAELAAPHLVITGGEPLLQETQLHLLFGSIFDRELTPEITLETNGTLLPKDSMLLDWIRLVSLSPKLQAPRRDILEGWFQLRAVMLGEVEIQLKVVCSCLQDYQEALDLFNWASGMSKAVCFVQLASDDTSPQRPEHRKGNRAIIEALRRDAPLAGGYPVRLSSQLHKSWEIP